MAKCAFCGKEFPDTHPGRKGNKFCKREHFREYKKIYGCGNKGKTWKEMYKPETLEKMEKRVNTKGKEHFNYGEGRPDLLLRNLINNPQMSEKRKEKLMKKLRMSPKDTLIDLLNNYTPDKKKAYQRKAFEKYGRKCQVCGETKGQLDIHHINGNHNNNELSNLMVLCPKHHREIHKQK